MTIFPLVEHKKHTLVGVYIMGYSTKWSFKREFLIVWSMHNQKNATPKGSQTVFKNIIKKEVKKKG